MAEPFLARIRDLKFKQLLVFERAVALGSTHKAAEDLHMSQPNVFKIINQLESLLDVPLFERTSKGLVPTVFAQRLMTRVKPLLGDARAMGEELSSLRNAELGLVNVGTLISAAARLLPQSIALMKQRHPRVDITVLEGSNNLLFPKLEIGELDLVVGRLPDLRSHDVSYHPLFEEQLVVVTRAGHPLTRLVSFSLNELVKFPWILPPSDSPVRVRVDDFFRHHQLPAPSNHVESLSLLTNIGLLQRSDTVTMLPRAAAKPMIDAGTLFALPITEHIPFGTIGYSLRAHRSPTPTTTAFIKALSEISAGIVSHD